MGRRVRASCPPHEGFIRTRTDNDTGYHDKWCPDEDLSGGLHLIFPDGAPGLQDILAVLHFTNISVRSMAKAKLAQLLSSKAKGISKDGLSTKAEKDPHDGTSDRSTDIPNVEPRQKYRRAVTPQQQLKEKTRQQKREQSVTAQAPDTTLLQLTSPSLIEATLSDASPTQNVAQNMHPTANEAAATEVAKVYEATNVEQPLTNGVKIWMDLDTKALGFVKTKNAVVRGLTRGDFGGGYVRA